MANWRHWAEVACFVFVVALVITSVTVAVLAVVGAWRAAKPLRVVDPERKAAATDNFTEEQKTQITDFWETWRKRYAAYSSEMNLLVNPLRRDGIEFIKESANWGRLAIQYGLIGNGGALAALPYLLSTTTRLELTIIDAIWSALFFATGLLSAALCCLIAYMDFQITAVIYSADERMALDAMTQRHFEMGDLNVDLHFAMRNHLRRVNVRTGLAGVTLGVISWFTLAWGAVRLIVSLAP